MRYRYQVDLCIALFLVSLLTLLGQTLFRPLPEGRLYGDSEKAPAARLTLESWFSGKFQRAVEDWFPRHVGFRSFWVRTDNQVDFSLFREARSANVLLGKDNWLYPANHEAMYRRWKPISTKDLTEEVRGLKRLQDELQRRGIVFLLVISPTKAAHYPEYLPKWIPSDFFTKRVSHHGRLAPLLHRYGVHYVDGVKRFREEKPRRPYLLFPRGGMHWTYYGASLVVEEILLQLEELTGKDLVNLECASVPVDHNPQGTDNDLGQLLNTWTPRATVGPTPHLKLARRATGSEFLPEMLWVGSSFSFTTIELMDALDAFASCEFLLYNRKQFQCPPKHQQDASMEPVEFDLQSRLPSTDVVILEANENQVNCVNGIDYGFVEDALEALRAAGSEG